MGKDSQILVPIMCLHKHKHSPYPSAHFCINGVPLSFEFLIIILGGGEADGEKGLLMENNGYYPRSKNYLE